MYPLTHNASPQSYFDSETKTNTEELLILKKTIDIIKHITCTGTSAPTAFPTAFPTTSPTFLSAQPTAYPTRSPTAVPTGAPTKQPTVGSTCVAGDWMFMSKVFKDPSKFAVPAYADGVVYQMAAGMTAFECKTVETSHTNVDGAVQTITHQYKCCGNSGNLYGSISQSDSATAKDLCTESENGDHCGLFGANMYESANGVDPSGDVTEGQTTAPTAAPTAYPTRSPTTSPTAYPTKAPTAIPTTVPTKAPTAFPTALAHADDNLQVSTVDSGADIYNHTMVSSVHPITQQPAHTFAPSAADRAASTTAVTTEITVVGMSATEFTAEAAGITAAIADVLEVHPTMVTVTVQSTNRRRLAAGDSVVLEVKVFVAPAAAAGMEAKVTAVQASPTVLATKVSEAAGPSVSCTPTEVVDQTPPAAPTVDAPTESATDTTDSDGTTGTCAATSCSIGGACTDGVDSFTCACATGYSGDTCATTEPICPPGEAFTAGSATADRTCAVCTSGYVGAAGTAAAQASCTCWSTTCPPGEAFTAGSATADRTCAACTSGYVDAAGTAAAQASCTGWSTTCPAGQAFTSGSATADRTCGVCTATQATVIDGASTERCVADIYLCASSNDAVNGKYSAFVYHNGGFAYQNAQGSMLYKQELSTSVSSYASWSIYDPTNQWAFYSHEHNDASGESPRIEFGFLSRSTAHAPRLLMSACPAPPSNDPASIYQSWYLEDIRVPEAWAMGFAGQGITIRVNDGGVDYEHPDIKPNFDVVHSYKDPMQDPALLKPNHGTTVSGLAAGAGNNGICGIGVAFNATLTAAAIVDDGVNSGPHHEWLQDHNQVNDISQNSWGLPACDDSSPGAIDTDVSAASGPGHVCPFLQDDAGASQTTWLKRESPCYAASCANQWGGALHTDCKTSIVVYCKSIRGREDAACRSYYELFVKVASMTKAASVPTLKQRW